jgi:hypothetical protein
MTSQDSFAFVQRRNVQKRMTAWVVQSKLGVGHSFDTTLVILDLIFALGALSVELIDRIVVL